MGRVIFSLHHHIKRAEYSQQKSIKNFERRAIFSGPRDLCKFSAIALQYNGGDMVMRGNVIVEEIYKKRDSHPTC